MIDLLVPALLSAVAGGAAKLLSTTLKDYLSSKRTSLRYEQAGSKPVEIHAVTDYESLEQRLNALQAISPRLAVLDGWNMVSAAILDRASSTLGKSYKPEDDVLQIASSIPDLAPELLSKMERLKQLRNGIAHGGIEIDDASMRQSVADIAPILTAVGMQFKATARV